MTQCIKFYFFLFCFSEGDVVGDIGFSYICANQVWLTFSHGMTQISTTLDHILGNSFQLPKAISTSAAGSTKSCTHEDPDARKESVAGQVTGAGACQATGTGQATQPGISSGGRHSFTSPGPIAEEEPSTSEQALIETTSSRTSEQSEPAPQCYPESSDASSGDQNTPIETQSSESIDPPADTSLPKETDSTLLEETKRGDY